MREIKFRVWHKTQKQMFTKLYLDFSGRIGMWDCRETEIQFDNYPFLELMQYTGLNDVKGKEIYEGDIVRYIDNRYETAFGGNKLRLDKIEWNNDGCCFFPMLYYCSDILIVGNIYENPELLRSEGLV